ncbi:MAG: tail fiber protein [Nitrococcus sp.]|nr:tail fiber protein [Nitrococcus sp.]
MAEPFIGEIQAFAFNFVPRGWAICDGALLPIAQYTALFSLLGTTYGGDGKTTFGLPNLVGRAACNMGQGPGLSRRDIGSSFGTATVALSSTQMPNHSHGLEIFAQRDPEKRSASPEAGDALTVQDKDFPFAAGSSPTTAFAPGLIDSAGGNQPHQNIQPYLAINFCIALQGIFPSFD